MELAGYEIAWRTAAGSRGEVRRDGLAGFSDDALELRLSFDGELLRAELEPREALRVERFRVLLRHGFSRAERCLVNGWQSWTATDWLVPDARQWGLRRVPRAIVERYVLDGSGDYRFCDYDARPGHLHGWSWAEVRELAGGAPSGDGWLLASTDEARGFTLIELDTPAGQVALEPEPPARELAAGSSATLMEFAVLHGPREAAYDRWFELMGVRPRPVVPLAGYSSWYRHYGDIDAQKLSHDLAGMREALASVDLGACRAVFQVDDGWAKVGDWLEPSAERFPDGMAAIAHEVSGQGQQGDGFLPRFSSFAANQDPEFPFSDPIRPKSPLKASSGGAEIPQNLKNVAENRLPAASGHPGEPKSASTAVIPGLWLAPFVCERDSRIFHQHPSWLLRDGLGNLVPTGSHWSGAFALDTLNPRVRAYVREAIRTVTRDWGFRFLKLDFLYAACMLPHGGLNRGELMADALSLLREAAGEDVLIDGCGVPLASAFGTLDYCRVGCDVGLDWDGAPPMRLLERERVSTRHSLACTRARSPLDGRAFGCDPDVFFLRDDVRLSEGRRRELLAADARCASMLLTSDDMGSWGPAQRALYEQALGTLSARKERP